MGKLEQYRKMILEKENKTKKVENKPIERKIKTDSRNTLNLLKKDCNGYDSWFESNVSDNLQRLQKHIDFVINYHVDEDNIHWYHPNKWNKKYESIGLTKEDIVTHMVHHIYEPDFVITLANGKKVFLEVKGWLTPQDRTKLKTIKKIRPDLDIRIIFQKKQDLKLKSGLSNIEWAEKNGFMACAGAMLDPNWFK